MIRTTTSPLDDAKWGEREYRMALTVWAEPGDTAVGAALEDDPIDEVIARIRAHDEASVAEFEAARQIAPRLDDTAALEHAFGWLTQHPDARFVIPGDGEWPEVLDDLDTARPYGLWVRGNHALTNGYMVCIDGCRASTAYGDLVAGTLATDLATQGCTMVSSAAHGIAATATRATLAGGASMIVVLGGGLERPHPHGHTDLIDRAAAHGAVVSEIPPGRPPTRAGFVARNRLMSGLATATVIVEAGARCGALATAGHASDLFRPVGVVPGPITSAASAGCHELLRDTDAFIVTCAHDIIEQLES